LVAVLVIGGVALALSACGGEGSAHEEANKARPLPEDRKDLRPGEYRSEEFKPSLTFRLGKEWANDPPEVSEELGLTWRWKVTANFFFFNWVCPVSTDCLPLSHSPSSQSSLFVL
jgi:hypothetical protein